MSFNINHQKGVSSVLHDLFYLVIGTWMLVTAREDPNRGWRIFGRTVGAVLMVISVLDLIF